MQIYLWNFFHNIDQDHLEQVTKIQTKLFGGLRQQFLEIDFGLDLHLFSNKNVNFDKTHFKVDTFTAVESEMHGVKARASVSSVTFKNAFSVWGRAAGASGGASPCRATGIYQ